MTSTEILSDLYGKPLVAWRADVQPVPLHRARIVLRSKVTVHGHLEDRDMQYRGELRLRWLAARLGRAQLEGDLAAAFTFTGRATRYTRNAPDLTNLVKAVEDAGNPDPRGGWRGLWHDDSQIKVLLAQLEDWSPIARPQVSLDLWRIG